MINIGIRISNNNNNNNQIYRAPYAKLQLEAQRICLSLVQSRFSQNDPCRSVAVS